MACRNPWAVFKTHRQLSILQNGQFTLKWSYWICSIVSFVNKQCTDFYKFADDGTAKVSGVTFSGVTTAPATPAMQGGGTLGGRHITKLTVC